MLLRNGGQRLKTLQMVRQLLLLRLELLLLLCS